MSFRISGLRALFTRVRDMSHLGLQVVRSRVDVIIVYIYPQMER